MNTVRGLIFVKLKLKRRFYKSVTLSQCKVYWQSGNVPKTTKLFLVFASGKLFSLGCREAISVLTIYIYIHLWYLSVQSNFTYRAHFIIIGDNNN